MNAPVKSPQKWQSETADSTRDLGFALPAPAQIPTARLILVALLIVVVLASVFSFTYLPRHSARLALERNAAASSRQLNRVAVVTPKLVTDGHALLLSGTVQPLEEAVVYARSSGYVKRWTADIGAHVAAGALLAELDTPEVEQELMQARASLAQSLAKRVQAQATEALAKTTLVRTSKMLVAGVASQQELDGSEAQSQVGDANVRVADADVAAQRANIQRLSDVRSYSRIFAPFAGTIIARMVDRGSLVTAGNATPLFRLASTDPVRVFVQVPQNVAPSVYVGLASSIRVREFPDVRFEGEVAHTAGALDSTSRTLNTEIRVPNRDGKLLVGMYVEVEVRLSVPHRVFELPSTALMNDASGLRIAVVDRQGALQLRNVVIERDLGPTVQIANGLVGDERVVQIASVELNEGQHVEVIL